MGEIGLTGEIRGIPHVKKRLHEAKKLGFTHCIIPSGSDIGGNHEKDDDLDIIKVKTLQEVLEIALI
jgi:DNA repair protein RadA/Sms